MHGGGTGLVSFAVPAAGAWGEYEGGVHSEGIVGGKVFVGIEFGCEGLEIRVQASTPLFEFTHGESGGLEGVGEDTGLHRHGTSHLSIGLDRTLSPSPPHESPHD